MPYEEIKWNDWEDWRDSWRDRGSDRTLINHYNQKNNKKIKIRERIRRLRKNANID